MAKKYGLARETQQKGCDARAVSYNIPSSTSIEPPTLAKLGEAHNSFYLCHKDMPLTWISSSLRPRHSE